MLPAYRILMLRIWEPIQYIFLNMFRIGAAAYRILCEDIQYIFLKMRRMVASINEAPWPKEERQKES